MFVYGTLRQGHRARAMINHHVASAISATTAGRLVALPAGYPGMLDDSRDPVVGELLELIDLPAAFALIDAYEGDSFRRVIKRAKLLDGSERWAWCYLLSNESLAQGGVLIESGDWNAYRRHA